MGSVKNKHVLAFLVVLLFIAAGYFLILKRTSPEPVQTGDASLKTFIDTGTGISFSYPEKLPTKYISTVDWPPKVQMIEEFFTCHPAGSEIERAGKTEKINIGGREYCRTSIVEGAAGSIYTQYAYAFPNNDNTIILTFTLRSVQCANYEEPAKTECGTERAGFNIDPLVDRIAGSIKF